MTEAEWLACEEPEAMLEFVAGCASPRQEWLLGIAYCRSVASGLERPQNIVLFIESVERFVDGRANFIEVEERRLVAWNDYPLKWMNSQDPTWLSVLAIQAIWPDLRVDEVIRYGRDAAAYPALARAAEASSRKRSYRLWKRAAKLSEAEIEQARAEGVLCESRLYCDLAHDIFDNLFRPVAFSPEWRTDTAVTLARQMYESRDFSAMPILADALQDAGCDSDDILAHCRDTAGGGSGEPAGGSSAQTAHVRGCWVVDLVLGKS